jgi:protein-disulfide isomerase
VTRRASATTTRRACAPSSKLRRGLLAGVLFLSLGCGGAQDRDAPPRAPTGASNGLSQASTPAQAGVGAAGEGDAGVPLSAGNPVWGSRTALVTIVEFADFQCPFCARTEPALARVREAYGPGVLRFVWKNLPLPFHEHARPAAEAAMGVFALAGSDAFWKFYHSAFDGAGRLEEGNFERWAKDAGVADIAAWRSGMESHTWAKAVEADLSDAQVLGVDGTPTFFVNGVLVVGQQSFEELKGLIDVQVKAAQAKVAAGTPRERVYAELSRENRARAPKPDPQDEEPPEDTKTVFKIPLGRSPQRGSPGALVTIVEFADYQCPYCARAEATLTALRQKYGDDLRVVFKDDPLDFHQHAEPAAEAALEVRAEKGEAAFWTMHDQLFASQRVLDDDLLVKLAVALGAKADAVRAAIARHTHAGEIEKDLELADDFDVMGTPNFFVNGRHLVGAQPQEKFEAIIDEEIKSARALVAGGTRPDALYGVIVAHGKDADPPEQRAVPALPQGDPSRGVVDAQVTVHEWADFQCPYCARVEPTLKLIMGEYQGKVRIVWHDFPLPMHSDAPLAAQAAREALKQKGEKGFWAIHDSLFDHQANLTRAELDGYASSLKLDMAAWRAALDGGMHRSEVDADAVAAQSANVTGTPAFLVVPRGGSRGYAISGAQPLVKFRKLVERALAEAK